jgi:hypothetical protein
MAKRVTITIEAISLLILQGRTSGRVWCDRCSAETEAVALDKVAASNRQREVLERWLSSVELHRLPSSEQSPLVCLHSLLARIRKPKSK